MNKRRILNNRGWMAIIFTIIYWFFFILFSVIWDHSAPVLNEFNTGAVLLERIAKLLMLPLIILPLLGVLYSIKEIIYCTDASSKGNAIGAFIGNFILLSVPSYVIYLAIFDSV